MHKKYLYLVLASLIIGGGISLVASPSPDGLEKVAEDVGFIGAAQDYPFSAIMPDYTFPGINNEYLAVSLAGSIGALLVFALSMVIKKLLLKRNYEIAATNIKKLTK